MVELYVNFFERVFFCIIISISFIYNVMLKIDIRCFVFGERFCTCYYILYIVEVFDNKCECFLIYVFWDFFF